MDELKLLNDLLLVLEEQEERFCSLLAARPQSLGDQPLKDVNLDAELEDLDLQGMRALMLGVQQGSLAEVEAAKAGLVTSAEGLASCGTAKEAANTSALQSAVAAAQAAHSSCRTSEQVLLLEQEAKYQALNSTWASLSAPSCSHTLDSADWQYRVSCFGDVQTWLETGASHIEINLATWVASLHAEHNQTSDCNALQQIFEANFCTWTETQDATCSTYQACFEAALAQHLELSSNANDTERLSKADYIAAAHVLCKLDVLDAASPAEKEEALARCKSEIVNTSHLDMAYPQLVSQDLCIVPAEFPCMASWLGQTYALASWYGVVDLLPCSPCYTTTTTTMPPSISAYPGQYHSLLLVNGKAWTWGRNQAGELGDSSLSDRPVPTDVMDGVQAGAAGVQTSYLVKQDDQGVGRVWAAGNNQYGQLGIGSTTQAEVNFVQSTDMGDVVKVAASSLHAVMLNREGEAWTVGRNNFGQLGDGTTTDRATPQKIMENIVDVCAGQWHTVLVTSSGDAYAFGNNDGSFAGQLGIGSYGGYKQDPTLVTVQDVRSCAAGGSHSMFLKSDGTVWATGYNEAGVLGDGTRTRRLAPVEVFGPLVRSISAGYAHTLFVKEDGTAWATGMNHYGQLGDGTREDKITPVQVMSMVANASVGYLYSLFVKQDGTLWAAGFNEYGQLGVSPSPMEPTPVQAS